MLVSKLLPVFIFSIIASYVVYILFFISPKNIVESDYISFVTGAAIVNSGEGEKLYDLDTQQKYQKEILGNYQKNIFLPYRNLPFVSLLIVPLVPFGVITGYKVFAIINLLLLIICSYFLLKENNSTKTINFSKLVLPLLFLGNILAIFYGQLSIVVLTLYVYSFIFLSRKRDFLVGLVFSLIFIKPQYVLALPFIFLLIRKKLPFLKGIIVGLSILLLISVLIADLQFLANYKNFIMETESSTYGSRVGEMFSLTAATNYVSQRYVVNPLYGYSLITLCYISMLLFFVKDSKIKSLEENFIYICFVPLIFSPHVLGSDLAILTLPILLNKHYELAVPVLFFLPISALLPGNNLVLLNSLVLITIFFILTKNNKNYAH